MKVRKYNYVNVKVETPIAQLYILYFITRD